MIEEIEEVVEIRSEGFYRLEGEQLSHAPNFVYAPTYQLKKEDKDDYDYPTEGGWSWFDDENIAREFFGLELIVVPEVPTEE